MTGGHPRRHPYRRRVRRTARHLTPPGRHAADARPPNVPRLPDRPTDAGGLRSLTTRRLTRQQRWRAVGAIAALVLVGTTVRSLWAAEAARASWSTTTAVVVATRDLPAGTVLDADDLDAVRLPDAVIPDDAALGDPMAVVGATVRSPIVAGEAVATARLGARGLGPTAALLPPGWQGVAVPLGPAPPLIAGDRVRLVAVAGGPGSGVPASVVAPDAEVLVINEDTLTVAVPDDEVTAVVAAIAQGLVTPVLLGG